jgi:ribosomal protein L19E
LKPEDSWAPPGDQETEESYHSNVRQLRDELKRLREEAQSA